MLKKIINFTSSLMSKKPLPWEHEINVMEDLVAIEHATKQLTLDFNKGLFDDQQYLAAFLSLDEKTHHIVGRVTEDFLATDHIDLDYRVHVANVVFLYHRQIYNTYLKFIKNAANSEQPTMLTMLLRATNSATEMIKWRYYQFQSAPTNIWVQLSKLYTIAEAKNLQNESMQLYSAVDDAKHQIDSSLNIITNMTQAYIEACMLGTLETLNFKASQLQLVFNILNTWSPKLTIDKEYDPQNHLFYVDVTQNAPAKRIRKFKPSSHHRYWSLDVINSKIELCLSLLEFNIAAKQAKIIEITSQKHALITLSALRAEWSKLNASGQRRSTERLSTTKKAIITYGFDATCNRIQLDESSLKKTQKQKNVSDKEVSKQDTTDSTKENPSESFTIDEEINLVYDDNSADSDSSIVDESNKGLGLLVRKHANELSLGMLVGVSVNGSSHEHKVGVVRNIKPSAGNQFHIGIELLSRSAFCADAENVTSQVENTATANEFSDSVSSFNHDFTRFTCIFLPKAFSNTLEDTLIIPRHQYRRNNLYSVNILGKNQSIKPTETLEQHENWVRVAYIVA
ncbi:MAG: hypothetical protein WBP13_05180 [Methylophilaceae bacterium]